MVKKIIDILYHFLYFLIFQKLLNHEGFNNLIKNTSILLSGNIIAWILGFLSLTLIARILNPDGFGTFVIITTYVSIIGSIVNFQSWQTVIKYGAEALINRDQISFAQIIKFCTLIDFFTAIISLFFSILVLSFFGNFFSIHSESFFLTTIFSFTLLFNVYGTPTGLLRLFGKYNLISIQGIITGFIKLFGVCVTFFFFEISIFSVVLIWMISSIIGNILLLFFGWHELKRHNHNIVLGIPFHGFFQKNPGLIRFLFSTNLSSTIRLGSKEMDIMLIGVLLSPDSVGLFKIAKQIALVPAMLSDPLYQTIYPDLSKLWAKKDYSSFKMIMIRSAFIAGLGGTISLILFILFGPFFINISFGELYLSAYSLTCLYMVAMVVAIMGVPLQPAMLAMGKCVTSLWYQCAFTMVYLIILFVFVIELGLIGAGYAIIGFYLMVFIIIGFDVRKGLSSKINCQ